MAYYPILLLFSRAPPENALLLELDPEISKEALAKYDMQQSNKVEFDKTHPNQSDQPITSLKNEETIKNQNITKKDGYQQKKNNNNDSDTDKDNKRKKKKKHFFLFLFFFQFVCLFGK